MPRITSYEREISKSELEAKKGLANVREVKQEEAGLKRTETVEATAMFAQDKKIETRKTELDTLLQMQKNIEQNIKDIKKVKTEKEDEIGSLWSSSDMPIKNEVLLDRRNEIIKSYKNLRNQIENFSDGINQRLGSIPQDTKPKSNEKIIYFLISLGSLFSSNLKQKKERIDILQNMMRDKSQMIKEVQEKQSELLELSEKIGAEITDINYAIANNDYYKDL